MSFFKMVIFSGHVSSVSSHIMNATDVNPLFYSALLLSALPVPLLRQVYVCVFLSIVKHYFGRPGRVLIPDFFVLFFLSVFLEQSLLTFRDFVRSQGVHRDPNGSHLGSLRGQIWV